MLADDVYLTVRRALLTHRIAPGARINLDALARELHVSHTPVRHALARLDSEGLVRREPFRGYSASDLLDKRSIAEVYDIRLMVEPTLAARAASVRDAEFAQAMSALCDPATIDRLVGDPAHVDELGRQDVAFHRLIAQQAGNRMAADALHSIWTRGVRYSMYYSTTAAQLAWDEHRAIAAAISTGNQADAAEAMRDHLVKALERYRSNFR